MNATLGIDMDTIYHVKIGGEWHYVDPQTWQIGTAVSFGCLKGMYTDPNLGETLNTPWFAVHEQIDDEADAAVRGVLTGPLAAIQAMRSNEPIGRHEPI